MRGSAASRGKRGEQRPPFSFLNDYPIASLLAAAIVCTWIVTRTLVFTHLHERASDHIGDVRARDMRQSKIRESGSAAVVQSASSSLLQTSVTSGQSLVSAAATASSTDKSKCHPKKNTLYGGATVFAPGGPTTQEAASQEACCKACQEMKDCNVWVFNPTTLKCTLKKSGNAWNPQILSQGDRVPEVSGAFFDLGKRWEGPGAGTIHTVLTSNGNSYMNWQSRVMYATYLKVAGGHMKAFTRVLHRHTDDELMHEIPTSRFDPVHINCDEYCSFPVADRAPALVEWMRTDDAKQCTHILLVETDYLFVKQVPASILPADGWAQAFPYGYIVPDYPGVMDIGRKFFEGTAADVPATGNAPVLMTRKNFETIMPVWSDIVLAIENDTVAVERLGWVRDMYAWSFAAAKTKLTHVLPLPPHNPLMVQPPADRELGDGCILHYTWGPEVYNSAGDKVWEFDKRSYAGGQYAPGPRELVKLNNTPKWEPGLHLQSFFSEANEVTESGLGLMQLLVDTFNAAVESLPRLPKGYTDLAEAQRVALPSEEARRLAEKVQAEIAKEEAKKRGEGGNNHRRGKGRAGALKSSRRRRSGRL